MMEKHRRHHIVLVSLMYMSKILIKMIIIHGRPSTRKLMHLILQELNYYSDHFLVAVKIILMSHKAFQLKSRIIFKISFEESLYEQAVMIRRKRMVHKRKNGKNLKKKTCFKGIFQYRSIGLILVFIGLKKISVQQNLRFYKRLKFKMDLNILHFLLLLEM